MRLFAISESRRSFSLCSPIVECLFLMKRLAALSVIGWGLAFRHCDSQSWDADHRWFIKLGDAVRPPRFEAVCFWRHVSC